MPVTYAALIFSLTFALNYVMKQNVFIIFYNILTVIVAFLYVIRIKVPKPKLIPSLLLFVLGIVMTIVYVFVV